MSYLKQLGFGLQKEASLGTPSEWLYYAWKHLRNPKQYRLANARHIAEAKLIEADAEKMARNAGYAIREPKNIIEYITTSKNGGGYTLPSSKEIIVSPSDSILTRFSSPFYRLFDGSGNRASVNALLKYHEANEAKHVAKAFKNKRHGLFLDSDGNLVGTHASPAVIAMEKYKVDRLKNRVVANRFNHIRNDVTNEYDTLARIATNGKMSGKDLNRHTDFKIYKKMGDALPNDYIRDNSLPLPSKIPCWYEVYANSLAPKN